MAAGMIGGPAVLVGTLWVEPFAWGKTDEASGLSEA